MDAQMVRTDRMQSEPSLLVEWAASMGDEMPYEVRMAVTGLRAVIEEWTEIRRRAV